MKILLLFVILLIAPAVQEEVKLKPYILGSETSKSIKETRNDLAANLKANDIQILGEYMPAEDANRWVIVVSSKELLTASKTVGGLTGFGASLRIGLTFADGKTQISYTNPYYWGNAYYGDEYSKVETQYKAFYNKILKSVKASGTWKGKYFGSKSGVSIKKLRKYQYMMGMPYFDDVVELEDFDSYEEAVKTIEANLKKGVENVKEVYSIEVPGKKLKLYGFALSGESGESNFLPTIDITNPKHTAFLPYEILVNDKEVVMLHGRYRIALSFPDLTMGTFTKIMSTPGDIEDLLENVCED